MRLTTKSRYGTRLILDLGVHGAEKPVPLSDISKRLNISLKYLEQLTVKLKKAGIIKSLRGAAGGHMLAKPAARITIGDIVRTLEDHHHIADCAADKKDACKVCKQAEGCLSRLVWTGVSKAMFDYLDSITVESLINMSNAGTPPSFIQKPSNGSNTDLNLRT